MFALTLIGECMLKELVILGKELKLSQAIAGYAHALAAIENVQVFAFADQILQENGEPGRYFMHKGEPPLVQLAD